MKLENFTRGAALVYAAALAVTAGFLLADAFMSQNPRVAILFASGAWGCAVGCAANVAWVFGYRYTAEPPAPGELRSAPPAAPRKFWCVICGEPAVVRCRLHSFYLCIECARIHDHREGDRCQYDPMPAALVESVYGNKA